MNATTKRVKEPVKKGVARVPVIMQMEALECGAACLTMVLAYYEKWVPLEKVRVDCGVSRDGSNAGNVLKAARYYGLVADGYKLEPQMLIDNAVFPCIIHWNFNHFVVLDGFTRNKAVLNDPARGRTEVSMEEFDESFTGICLMFSPGEDFEPSGKPKSVLSFAGKRLKGAGPARFHPGIYGQASDRKESGLGSSIPCAPVSIYGAADRGLLDQYSLLFEDQRKTCHCQQFLLYVEDPAAADGVLLPENGRRYSVQTEFQHRGRV